MWHESGVDKNPSVLCSCYVNIDYLNTYYFSYFTISVWYIRCTLAVLCCFSYYFVGLTVTHSMSSKQW